MGGRCAELTGKRRWKPRIVLGEEDVYGRDLRLGDRNGFNEPGDRCARPRPRSNRIERPAVDVHDDDTRAIVVAGCGLERAIRCEHEIESGFAELLAPAFRQQQLGGHQHGERDSTGGDRDLLHAQ